MINKKYLTAKEVKIGKETNINLKKGAYDLITGDIQNKLLKKGKVN